MPSLAPETTLAATISTAAMANHHGVEIVPPRASWSRPTNFQQLTPRLNDLRRCHRRDVACNVSARRHRRCRKDV